MSDGWHGGAAAPGLAWARCVLASNPGPMTLDGTNTWVLAAPGAGEAIVVDPGPNDERHLAAVLAAATAAGRRVALTLLTHGHADHSAGAARFAELAGAPVWALDPAHRRGVGGPGEGGVVEAAGLVVEVLVTPGHTSDSVSFLATSGGGSAAVLTGDTMLGRGSTVVAHPDGRLADYLGSLTRLQDVVATRGVVAVLPGHGPPLQDPVTAVAGYLRHRAERLDQVRAALAVGARTVDDVVELVYADVDRALWPAAALSVRAQLDYLRSL